MSNVTLNYFLQIHTDTINLNDRVNFRLVREPFSRKFNQFDKSYQTVEESVVFDIVGSDYQQVQNNLARLARFIEQPTYWKQDPLADSLLVNVVASGGIVNPALERNSFVARVTECELVLPDNEATFTSVGGILGAQLNYTRTPYQRSLSYLGYNKTFIVTLFEQNYRSQTRNSIPHTFTVSGIPQTEYHSPVFLGIYDTGTLASGVQYTRTFVAVTNNPESRYVDLTSGIGTATQYLNATTASGGATVRFPGNSSQTPIIYRPNNFPNTLTFTNASNIELYGVVRCAGTWRLHFDIIPFYTNQLTALPVSRDPIKSDEIILSNVNNAQTGVTFLGNIHSDLSIVNATFSITATPLTAGGNFDIDTVLFLPNNDISTSVFYVEQDTTISGASFMTVVANPTLGRYTPLFIGPSPIDYHRSFNTTKSQAIGIVNYFSSINPNIFADTRDTTSPLFADTRYYNVNTVGDTDLYYRTYSNAANTTLTSGNAMFVYVLSTTRNLWDNPRPFTVRAQIGETFPYLPRL